MNKRIRTILSWYTGSPPGVLTNLYRVLCHGTLSGTGKMVILPVDQGFEHGPARSFSKVPAGYDPRAHFELAAKAQVSAHAAPLGALEAGAAEYAGHVPLILKLNNADTLSQGQAPCPSLTASVRDALRLGCVAVGYTLYSGSPMHKTMVEEVREIRREAESVGLPLVIWSYPRGGVLSKKGETAIDVVAYAAHVACQLGAHIIKVKPPSAHVELAEAKKIYTQANIAIDTLAMRVRHVVDACFGGRRLVIFSGGPTKEDKDVLSEVQSIAAGGAAGAVIGRNIFQRPEQEALKLLSQINKIYAEV